MSKTSRILLVIFLAFLPTSLALGQTTTGSIFGDVLDSTGASVPGAEVTVTNQETALRRSTLSNDVGAYNFGALFPGIYTVAAEMPGFKKYEQTDVQVTVGSNIRVSVELQIGEITESITVTGGTMMVDTRTPELSSLIDDRRITDLPLSGRNVIALAGLLPGVSTVSAPQVQTGSRAGPRLTVHGSRRNGNYFTLNGSYFMNPSRNTGMNPPAPDAIREFRIKTNNFSAAEGRNSGAILTMVTRSGTNEFHGAAWDFHRNDNLNARQFFQAEKAQRIMNQYGIAAGGPIVKDKAFIFGSYEGFRDRPAPSETSAFPPTAAERAGNFSHVGTQLVNPYTGEEFAGNQIPTSLFDPVSVGLLSYLPLPNLPDDSYQEPRGAPTNNDMLMLRSDLNISDTQDLFVHYYYNHNARPNRLSGNIPGWGDYQDNTRVHNTALTHNYVLSPTLLNSFTFGYMSNPQLIENLGNRTTEELGMDFPNYTDYGAPQFRLSGRFDLRSQSQFDNHSKNWNFHESMTLTKGQHNFKYGAEYFRLSFFQAWLSPPSFSFNGTRSGDIMSDFMLGAWRDLALGYGRRKNDTYQPYYWSFYFQDEWRVMPRLTLTLGLRYEVPSPWNDRRELGLSSVVLPLANCLEDLTTPGNPRDLVACGAQQTTSGLDAPPGFLFANFDLPGGLVEPDRNNFAPRLGFAWDTCGDGITSVRGGFGVFYDTANADTLAQINAPFAGTDSYHNGRLGAPNVGLNLQLPPSNPTPESGGFFLPMSGLINWDLSARNPYFFHWNLGVQRQVSRDLLVTVDYVGKIGRKGLALYGWNPAVYMPGNDSDGNPLSTLENIDDRTLYARGVYGAYYNLMIGSMFDTWYHGMDVQVNKRLSNGVSVLSSFTWSKAIDQNSTENLGADTPNPFDIKKSEQGLAAHDRRIVWATSALWEPFVNRTNPLLKGWAFAPIFRATTGGPLEFYTGDDVAMDGASFGEQHAVALRNPQKDHSSVASKITEYFDTSALTLAEPGHYGNAGKGLIAGPGFWTFDLGILRDFAVPLTEESRVQFRAEFFNMFNHTNFSNPTTTVLSSNFGRIRGSGDAREIQFGLKFIW